MIRKAAGSQQQAAAAAACQRRQAQFESGAKLRELIRRSAGQVKHFRDNRQLLMVQFQRVRETQRLLDHFGGIEMLSKVDVEYTERVRTGRFYNLLDRAPRHRAAL